MIVSSIHRVLPSAHRSRRRGSLRLLVMARRQLQLLMQRIRLNSQSYTGHYILFGACMWGLNVTHSIWKQKNEPFALQLLSADHLPTAPADGFCCVHQILIFPVSCQHTNQLSQIAIKICKSCFFISTKKICRNS